MVWRVEFSDIVDKQLSKLDKNIRHRIISWLEERLSGCNNPRLWGKALSGSQGEKWRYRVGDYRILCLIKDQVVTVEVVKIGHRKEVYD